MPTQSRAIAVKGDVAKAADVRRLFEETRSAFGRVDVLVNNAGIYHFQPLEDITEDEFHLQSADHEPVGERPADAMRHHDPTRAGRKMREDEECCEPIMRHEADVPWVLDQPGWRAGGEAPSGVDAKICPGDRIAMVFAAVRLSAYDPKR